MALSASKNNLGRAFMISLIAHLKALKQKEANTPKRSRRQEITKFRVEINHLQMKNYINNQNNNNKNKTNKQTKTKKTQKPEAGSLTKSTA